MNPIEVLYRPILGSAQVFSMIMKGQIFRAVKSTISLQGIQAFLWPLLASGVPGVHIYINGRDVFCRRKDKTVNSKQLSEWSVGKDTCHARLIISVQSLELRVEGGNRLHMHDTHSVHMHTHTRMHAYSHRYTVLNKHLKIRQCKSFLKVTFYFILLPKIRIDPETSFTNKNVSVNFVN